MSTAPMTLTPAEVEEGVRSIFQVWSSLDPIGISELYSGAPGFGYRTREPRARYASREAYLEAFQSWLGSMLYYRIAIDEIHTAVDGDIGIAWGFYHEEFQARGREAEVRRGRFSEVIKRGSTGWQILFYHRDATPFDSRGVYIPPPRSVAG